MAPPPPSPLIQGSSTPSANVVAITASTQSPPAASTSAPTAAALPDCAATMPPLDVVAGLRICWVLLNWSRMLLPSLPWEPQGTERHPQGKGIARDPGILTQVHCSGYSL